MRLQAPLPIRSADRAATNSSPPSAWNRLQHLSLEVNFFGAGHRRVYGIVVILGASIIRIGFGGILYYNFSKKPPKPYFELQRIPTLHLFGQR